MAATITTKPSVPPAAPPITAAEGFEPLRGADEASNDGFEVDRGAVDDSRMFRSSK